MPCCCSALPSAVRMCNTMLCPLAVGSGGWVHQQLGRPFQGGSGLVPQATNEDAPRQRLDGVCSIMSRRGGGGHPCLHWRGLMRWNVATSPTEVPPLLIAWKTSSSCAGLTPGLSLQVCACMLLAHMRLSYAHSLDFTFSCDRFFSVTRSHCSELSAKTYVLTGL